MFVAAHLLAPLTRSRYELFTGVGLLLNAVSSAITDWRDALAPTGRAVRPVLKARRRGP